MSVRPHLRTSLEIGPSSVAVVSYAGSKRVNVFLVDRENLARYRGGKEFDYVGGHFKKSPAVIRPPRGGKWHVIVDLGGRTGSVSAEVTTRRARADEEPDEQYSSEDEDG